MHGPSMPASFRFVSRCWLRVLTIFSYYVLLVITIVMLTVKASSCLLTGVQGYRSVHTSARWPGKGA